MDFRCIVPDSLGPIAAARSNHAEMVNTTYAGGDANPFAFDPDDGLITTNKFSTPIVIAWARAPVVEGVFVGGESYESPYVFPDPNPPHDDWFDNFDHVFDDDRGFAITSGGITNVLNVDAATWRHELPVQPDTAPFERLLQWPLKLDFMPFLMNACGFIVLHVVPNTKGFEAAEDGDDQAESRGRYAKIGPVAYSGGLQGTPVELAPPPDVPPRGLVVQFLHQSGDAENDFFLSFGAATFLDDPAGNGLVMTEQGTGYGRGADPGFNWMHMWRCRVTHDHEDDPAVEVGPDVDVLGNALHDWMCCTFAVAPPSSAAAHLRHRKRDDSNARVVRAGNTPTSRQRGIRASQRNTYA